MIVAATEAGAIFGLDSLNGSILWTYRLRGEQDVRIEGTWLIKPATSGQAPTVAVLVNEVFEGVGDVAHPSQIGRI